MHVHKWEWVQTSNREENTGEKQEAGCYLRLFKLATVQLEWNVAEKEVRLGGMTGRVGWALFSAVMTGVTSCSHLQGVSEVNKLAQWRNTHQTERKTKEIFCFLPSYCQSVEISTIQQEGERRKKKVGKNRRKCVEYQTLKGNITIKVGRFIGHRMLLSLYTDVCSTSTTPLLYMHKWPL